MRWALSIRLRLTLLYTAILALTVIAFSAVVYATQEQSAFAGIKADLERQASFFVSSGGKPEPRPFEPRGDIGSAATRSSLPSGTLPGRWTQTRSLTGEVTGQTLDLSGVTLPLSDAGMAAVRDGAGWYETVTVQEEPLLIYSQQYSRADGATGIVQTAFPVGQPQLYLATLRLLLLGGSSLAILAALGLGWALAGAALRPIQRITQTAQAIGAERNFSRRVAHRGPTDEVGQLARTFNAMLTELESGYHQLEDALSSQRRFVADASHELRTPLTTVRGNIELLHREPQVAAEERAEILADTTEEVDRLIRLVNQLLALARADAGQTLRSDPIPVAALLQDVCRQARLLDARTEIRCEAPAETLVQADRDALKQVLLILLDNAVAHTPAGTPVTLAASVVEDRVILSVRDCGPGIAAEMLPHIFERFYRGETSRTGGGAGLGLAIAKELVEAQGGALTVESQAGQGSVFTVTMMSA
jgi:signal transduction histidine kinase